jgi:hypothetical protein
MRKKENKVFISGAREIERDRDVQVAWDQSAGEKVCHPWQGR